ncbi:MULTISPECIES: FmdB family zinc ribbon protein [Kocuria]|uniref:FmdB family zinc ribbon protein n=1 Tax=Kocuria TaxID=57493 RepID=UPI000BABCC0A|nr:MULTISPECIES: FmdB family zinc ribbon protein [Kocuria]MCC5784992.1 FmdB family transcriptional regulator [Kocuria sp. CCUG 69068]MEB2526743.1 FmdB family zinc ribbon protein [Kocuria rosea]MEB2618684.1 FmdB family zinc ribbon protein [Kocuria rosea]PAU91222.1 FmdB family transcriptional regulator [Kocuria sp. WN036]VEI49204.1 putative regulatory protein, FmdB family [Kocuria rosea]
MPVYAYACKDCGHAFDIRQSFSEDALTVCPECDGGLRKKFNTVGVVFKGSGFYRNDSRSGGADSGASTSSASSTAEPAAPAKTATPATAGAGASSSSASATAGGSSD